MKYIVTSETPIWIKETPSITSKNIGLVHKDDVLTVLNELNGYIQTERGYVLKSLDSMSLVQEFTMASAPTITTTAAAPLITTATDNAINASEYTVDDLELMSTVDRAAYLQKNTDKDPATNPQPKNGVTKPIKTDNVDNNSTVTEPKKTNENTNSNQELVVVHLDQLLQNKTTKDIMFSNTNGVYGLPYQWLPITDPRIFNNKLNSPGRIYTERIISKMPLFLISPGGPHYNATGGKSILDIIKQEATVGEDLTKSNLNDNEGIFYSFEYDLVQYFTYVNPILRLAAHCLGIGDRTYQPASGGKAVRLDEFNWETNYNQAIHGLDARTDTLTQLGQSGMTGLNLNEKTALQNMEFVGARSIAFYLDSDFSQSESISNSAMESSLKAANSYSSRLAEYRFLFGLGSSAAIQNQKFAEGIDKAKSGINSWLDSLKGNGDNRFLNNLVNTANTMMEGGKLMFPSIWGDSNFSRSYDVKFKFVSPDYDTYSWYINIMVPLVHLLCLTFPRKAASSFGYSAPFLVRAFYKGFFNCDLGLISGLNISRGQESGWTQSGLPTIVEVSMSIQDLYDGMAMSRSDIGGTAGMFAILKNPLYLDYIANMCGLNLNEPDVRRIVSFYRILMKGAIGDLGPTIMGKASQILNNYLIDIFGKMQRAGL